MYVYDFLKNNKPMNVQFNASKGIIKFVAPVEGSRWCMKSREDFSRLYGELVNEYLDFHLLDMAYTVFYIDRSDENFADVIKFYANWNECTEELRGHSNMPRKCVRDETIPFILNFMQKDFSADRIERSWYFGDKRAQEKTKELIAMQKENPAAALIEGNNGQMTIPVISKEGKVETPGKPLKKSKKELEAEEKARKCRENGLNPDELPPWETVDDFIEKKKSEENNLVTVHITLKKEDLDRILANFDVKLIGGIKGEVSNETPVFADMTSFFDELDKSAKKKTKKKTGKTKNKTDNNTAPKKRGRPKKVRDIISKEVVGK